MADDWRILPTLLRYRPFKEIDKNPFQETIMAKSKDAKKETKKQPTKTPKEKKAAKAEKKAASKNR